MYYCLCVINMSFKQKRLQLAKKFDKEKEIKSSYFSKKIALLFITHISLILLAFTSLIGRRLHLQQNVQRNLRKKK